MKNVAVKSIEQIEADKYNALAMQIGNKVEAQDAFNQIYKRYKNPLFYEALKFVKMDEESAKDMNQEIFAKVFEKINLYDFSTAFSTWLYNLAKNHLIDVKRKHKVEVLSVDSLMSEHGGDDSMNEIAFQIEDKDTNLFKNYIQNERAEQAIAALNSIKSELGKQIITLIFIEEESYENTAIQLGLPIGTVKGLMHRSKAEMKKFLINKSTEFEYGRIHTKPAKAIKAAEEEEIFEEDEY